MNKLCKACGQPLKKPRTNKTGFCKKCRRSPRCQACGRLTKADGSHECASIDLRGERHCEICNRILHNDNWERWSRICRRCSARKWRAIEKKQRKELVQDWGGRCQICGYSKCKAALHFHHKDASEKYDWNVKGKGGASIREVKAHPERFQLVCVRCHVEIHFPDK